MDNYKKYIYTIAKIVTVAIVPNVIILAAACESSSCIFANASIFTRT